MPFGDQPGDQPWLMNFQHFVKHGPGLWFCVSTKLIFLAANGCSRQSIKPDGYVDKNKDHLVARGFTQQRQSKDDYSFGSFPCCLSRMDASPG
jgi:hypothetical protein